MCISPTRGPVEMRKDLIFASRKKQRVSLTKFLHEDMNKVSRDFSMSGNRMGRYVFDKVTRTMKFYAVDIEDDFTSQEPCLIFPAEDWWLFYNNVWRDLNDCGNHPLYIAEWDSIIPGKRFRVVGDHSKKLPDDCVYIFYCEDKTKINERTWPIPESEHYMHYEMRFLFQWKDIHIIDDVFTCIDKMFRWCDMYDRYKPSLISTHILQTLIDDTDGCIHSDGFKIIKATVVVILEHLINKKLKDLCTGCEVEHPSQLRHSCLFEPNAYFFDAYFEELSRNLIKPELNHIIARALNRYGLRVNPQRIQGSVDAILCELRDEVYIVEKLRQVREKLVDVNSEQIVYDAVDSWKGGPQTITVPWGIHVVLTL
ncbi:hypothetical protein M9458_055384 [Cirrhinus mrigala]|uniref:Uncharacterized protein n=1 Tax=Cirrhinus mrigala TaxID=683832 RepID=A0ABD0ML27_CIRMR